MIRKLRFTKQAEAQNAKQIEVIGNVKDCLNVITIEIKSPTPSELTMKIEKKDINGIRSQNINLADFRTQFIFQNGVYILDAQKINDFFDSSSYHEISISFFSIEENTPIDIDLFYKLSEAKKSSVYL